MNEPPSDDFEEVVPVARNEKKPFYKKPAVIAAIISAIILAAILGVLFYLSSQNKSSYESSANDIWDDVIESSNTLKDALSETKDVDDFNQLSDDNADHVAVLKDKIVEVKSIEAPEAYKKSHKNLERAIRQQVGYFEKAQEILDDPYRVETDTDFVEFDRLARDAKLASQDFVDSADSVDDDIPVKIFDMPDDLRSIAKEAQSVQEEKEEQDTAREKQEQEATEKSSVENSVEGWMEALKDNNTSDMSNYMTTDAYARLDPNEFEGDYTVDDYKLTQTTKISATKYESKVTEYDTWSNGDRTTTTRLFTVVKIGDKWLIDEQNIIN